MQFGKLRKCRKTLLQISFHSVVLIVQFRPTICILNRYWSTNNSNATTQVVSLLQSKLSTIPPRNSTQPSFNPFHLWFSHPHPPSKKKTCPINRTMPWSPPLPKWSTSAWPLNSRKEIKWSSILKKVWTNSSPPFVMAIHQRPWKMGPGQDHRWCPCHEHPHLPLELPCPPRYPKVECLGRRPLLSGASGPTSHPNVKKAKWKPCLTGQNEGIRCVKALHWTTIDLIVRCQQ